MLKRSILAAALLASSAIVAQAADLAVKAPAALPAYVSSACTVTPLSCSGFYLGGGLAGQGSNADILGNGINGSVFAGGITPTVDAGYQYVNGNWVFGAEADMGYAVDTGASVNGIGGGVSGLRFNQLFKVGGNLAGFLGTQAPIQVPAALANSILAPYAHVGVAEWQLSGAWAAGNTSGAGLLFDIGPHIFGDLRYTYTNFNGAKAANGLTINNDQSVTMLISYKF